MLNMSSADSQLIRFSERQHRAWGRVTCCGRNSDETPGASSIEMLQGKGPEAKKGGTVTPFSIFFFSLFLVCEEETVGFLSYMFIPQWLQRELRRKTENVDVLKHGARCHHFYRKTLWGIWRNNIFVNQTQACTKRDSSERRLTKCLQTSGTSRPNDSFHATLIFR